VSNRDGRADSILVAVAFAITIVGGLILASRAAVGLGGGSVTAERL